MRKAIVIFSGGQDSTTCLFWAIKKFDFVKAVTFDYDQRHIKEVEVAKSITEKLKVPHQIIKLPEIKNIITTSSLTNIDIPIGKIHEKEYPNSFVPGRNLLFITYASIVAYQENIGDLVLGASEADYSGYPDCRESFIKNSQETLKKAMDRNFKIHVPLIHLDKSEVWELAYDLGAYDFVIENTLTCYNGIMSDGCGTCPACKLRNKGLLEFEKRRYRYEIKKSSV
ncbi:7-cyano-7-deazaguanine synthase QueC [Paramaledivibacter caminithermalis]|jgi:7-cyano-7-deazaguanine synthase|uniref:7-cyano-7-deazaguanine synthase n=1 Tax=Paramaledivibacter caminithermalis (strain DSM 15212 / CIP 107654 / DViRD3) TaxID=1121301 RepID=A0A1M6QZB3_PARC5|nr:7-cyano-7-deazaguanine synthase QueC [Paramaledivibacter caminithermalis]SHK25599.1 7-cyano-7-deazaguanine synthase [Paramaledivibacter caminithermalis DSM 15212]